MIIEGADGISAEGGIFGEEGVLDVFFFEESESVEGPEGVDGCDAGLFGEVAEGCFGARMISLNQQTLSGESPELVVTAECGDEGRGVFWIEGGDFRSGCFFPDESSSPQSGPS